MLSSLSKKLLFLLFVSASMPALLGQILSENEEAWVKAHPVIRVQNDIDRPPFNFSEYGIPRGLSVEYMKLIGDTVGLEIEFVTGPSPDEFLSMIKEKEIDVIMDIARTPEREEYLRFTEPYFSNPWVIVSRTHDSLIRPEELFGKTAAVPDGLIYKEIFESEYPEIRVLAVPDILESLKAVISKSADGAFCEEVAARYIISRNELTGLYVSEGIELGDREYQNYRFAVREDWPELRNILEKGLRAFSGKQIERIRKTWLYGNGSSSDLELDENESIFLAKHHVIRVQNESGWLPYNFNENGIPSGISVDYINLLMNKAGLEAEYITGRTFDEYKEMIRSGMLDVIIDFPSIGDGKVPFLLTEPHFSSSNVLISSEKKSYFSLDELKGKTLTCSARSPYLESIKKNYPGIDLVVTGSISEAMQAVIQGKAEAALAEEALVKYQMAEYGFSGLILSREIVIEEENHVDFSFCVRNDWPELRSILNKAMRTVSVEEMEAILEKWTSYKHRGAALLEMGPGSYSESRFPLFVIPFLLSVILIAVFLIQKIIRDKARRSGVLDLRKIRAVSIFILGLTLIFIVLITHFGIKDIKSAHSDRIEENLRALVSTSDEILIIWIDKNLSQLETDAGKSEFVRKAEALFHIPRDPESLIGSPEVEELRRYFKEERPNVFSQGFFIIAPDGTTLASVSDDDLGTKNLIIKQRPELLEQVFLGSGVFILPVPEDSGRTGNSPSETSAMYYAVPVKDNTGIVTAVLALREDPSREFSRFCQMSRMGRTGETYAFDQNGLLLSASRFEDQLVEDGILEAGRSSILNVSLVEPDTGGNPTKLMRNVSEYKYGVDMTMYTDYRGEKVFGAWIWNDDYNFGIATEIDVEDAFSSITKTTALIHSMAVLLFLLTAGSSFFNLAVGEKANASLKKANDELEAKVNSRTRELSQSKKDLENTLEALTHPFYVIDAENYEILIANSMAKKSSEDEIITTCHRLTHRKDVPCDGKDHPCPLKTVKETGKPSRVEHIHYDSSGNEINVEVYGYPITDENGKVVKMIEYSLDITDKKKAEKTMKENMEDLEQFNRLAVGREEKMILLKEEINRLLKEMGRDEKYEIVEE